jgi:hypothetical protein
MAKIIQCLRCSKDFESRNGGPTKYCGRECANLAQRKPKEKTCEVCGATFFTGYRGENIQRPGATRCSRGCRRLGRQRKSAESKMLSAVDAAYMAGLIDGEGCLMLHGRGNGTVGIRLTITNTVIGVLNWCRDVTGIGSVCARTHQDPRWKTSYGWVVSCGAAESVLKQILPFMKIKQDQTRLALETQERLRNPALKADRTWQAEYRERMKAMNKRGPAAEL